MSSIRIALDSDQNRIRDIYLKAFPENEREVVAELAVNLLHETTVPETLSLVAQSHGAVMGHVAFSPVFDRTRERWKGFILAPLAVDPEQQRLQVGSRLVEYGKQRLAENGVNHLFVYGDPDYYARFGFEASLATGFQPPYPLEYPFGWQCVELNAWDGKTSDAQLSCVDSLDHEHLW